MTELLASLDYILPVIPKYRTASYHGRKHFVFVRTMLALPLLRLVLTITMQTVGMQAAFARSCSDGFKEADGPSSLVVHRNGDSSLSTLDFISMEDYSGIQVWHAGSSSSEPGILEQCCENWLSQDERVRADRFRIATSRNQHVVGRGMARRLLGREQIDPCLIAFAIEKNGKPYVSQPVEARRSFNIAHTDGLVMCGIDSHSHDLLGVDVEKLGRRTDPALAKRYFSKPEVEHLERCVAETDRRNKFLKIWTLKEAFIKAIGTGLQTPLADFAFDKIESAEPEIRFLNPKLESETRWSFVSIEPRPGYVGAVALGANSARASTEVTLRRFEELL
ncbi:4'-phosphopantetheinyl transferase superfamily protein [Rubripirellula sp.]|nr:4'-phosphopantetheinyl transferase superfamily protein [Rubripirellula sp.]